MSILHQVANLNGVMFIDLNVAPVSLIFPKCYNECDVDLVLI